MRAKDGYPYVVAKYIDDVLDGRVVVGKYHRLAIERHVRDLKEGPGRGLRFDEAAAIHKLNFCRFLKHHTGEWAGQTFAPQPWQVFRQWCLFGWLKDDGRRRFRSAYTTVGRKNGKSFEAADTANYLLVADGEPRANVFVVATKRDQARLVFDEAVLMVRASPELKNLITVQKTNMCVESTHSKFEPLAAQDRTLDGLNPHGAILDELHEHTNRGIWDKFDTATGSRRQPMLYAITTAGVMLESICAEIDAQAVKVLDGVYEDDSFFAFIARIDDDDDWHNEECWVKANPNLGICVKLDDLQRKALQAKNNPAKLNSFLRYHMNRWTEQIECAFDMDSWNACGDGVDIDELIGRPCFGGLDLASKRDVAAWVLVFPPYGDDEKWRVLPRFWVPGDNAEEREREDRANYVTWSRQGFITLTPGKAISYEVIRQQILNDHRQFDIQGFAADPWNFLYLKQRLQAEDSDWKIEEFHQNIKQFSEPTKELLDVLIPCRLLAHGGNPVLRWMATNAAAKQDPSDHIRLDKIRSRDRIDGLIALIMAIGLAMKEELGFSDLYTDEGVFTV